jgi:hypothetical protein
MISGRFLVDVRLRSRELHRVCNERRAMDRRFGAAASAVLAQTLDELLALERLGDIAARPYIRIQRGSDGIALESMGLVRLGLTAQNAAGGSAKSWRTCDCVVIFEIEVLKK